MGQLTLDGQIVKRANITIINSSTLSFFEDAYGTSLKQIKTFDIGGRKFWALKGYTRHCNGSFCAYVTTLLYDLSRNRIYGNTDTSNSDEVYVNDFNSDGQIDLLEISYSRGMHTNTSDTIHFNVWTQNQYGEFEKLTDHFGKPYFIKAHFKGGLSDAHHTRVVAKHWMKPINFP